MSDLPAKDVALALYRKMLTIRRFEERCNYLFMQGKIPSTLHLYIGQEAVATGVCAQLATTTTWPAPTGRTATPSPRGSRRVPSWPSCSPRAPAAAVARAARCTWATCGWACSRPSPSSVRHPNRGRAGPGCQTPGNGRRGGVLLRRRRGQRGRLPRRPEHGGHLEAARHLRLREQSLWRLRPRSVHVFSIGDVAERAACLWHPRRDRGRQRRAGRVRSRGTGRGPRPGRRRADAARMHDLPPVRPLAQRPTHLPHQGGRGRMGPAGPDPRAWPSGCRPKAWSTRRGWRRPSRRWRSRSTTRSPLPRRAPHPLQAERA